MEDFIKFSEFQKMVNFTPIKTWRLFDKLRRMNTLKEGVDWKSEAGELYVVPSRLFVEAKNLRPELQYVISNDFKMKSNEIKQNQKISFEIVELLKSQIKTLKNDKNYLREQLEEKTHEVRNLNNERAYLMQDWRRAIQENDELRKLLSGPGQTTETTEREQRISQGEFEGIDSKAGEG